MAATLERMMTVEEYIQFESTSELRHEYINGQLFEMPGEQVINSVITNLLTAYFATFLTEKEYRICSNVVKVAIPGGGRYYYPDWFITKELLAENNRYIQYEPELIIEVISKTSRIHDTVNKYLDYIKIPSLKYYLIIDPDRTFITVYLKDKNGQWEAEAYSNRKKPSNYRCLGLNCLC